MPEQTEWLAVVSNMALPSIFFFSCSLLSLYLIGISPIDLLDRLLASVSVLSAFAGFFVLT